MINTALGGAGARAARPAAAGLLVEDNDGDAVLVQELLAEAGAGITVDRAHLLAEGRSTGCCRSRC